MQIDGSVELIVPAPFIKDSSSIRTLVFFDIGNVFQTECLAGSTNCDSGIEFDELRYSAGIGFSWLTPVGPLSFALAQPLNSSPGMMSRHLNLHWAGLSKEKVMNIFKTMGLVVALGLSSSAMADKVATLSVQQALLSSQAAEAFRQKMTEEFKPQAAQLAELESQVKQMQGDLQSAQAAGASQADLQQKNLQFQKLVTEYQRQGQEMQLQQREREQAF